MGAGVLRMLSIRRWGCQGIAALLVGCSIVSGQTIEGVLKLVDRPTEATPVEALNFRLHPLTGGFDLEARPDREGKFSVSNVKPGRYSLVIPMPGRVESFTGGSGELAPEDFEPSGPLTLVISMKSGDVSVNVQGLPLGRTDIVALLVPADNRLTLRESCYLNTLSGTQTTFRFVPPGHYRVLVLDALYQQQAAAIAPRAPDFLKAEATSIEAPGSATATYINPAIVKAAIAYVQRSR